MCCCIVENHLPKFWNSPNFSVLKSEEENLKNFSQNSGKIVLCGVVNSERKIRGFGETSQGPAREYKQKSPAVGRQKTGDFTEKSTVERFKDFRLSAPKKSASEMAKSSYFLFISGCRGHGFRFDGFFLRSFLAVLLQTQQYVDIYMVRFAS